MTQEARTIIDASTNVVPFLSDLKQAGITTVGRYYSSIKNSHKIITKEEAQAISEAGFNIFVVFEDGGDKVNNFSHESGIFDAQYALAYAQNIGQPQGSAIYFAADFDVSNDELKTAVLPYYEAVQSVFASAPHHYKIGAYSNGLACAALLDAKLCDYAWLSESQGFQQWHSFYNARRWALAQFLSPNIGKLGVDRNEANGDFGQFSLAVQQNPAPPAPNPPTPNPPIPPVPVPPAPSPAPNPPAPNPPAPVPPSPVPSAPHGSYTVLPGHWYEAIIRLYGVEQLAANEAVAQQFEKIGFVQVNVAGAGAVRTATGVWNGVQSVGSLDSHIIQVIQLS